MNRVRLFDWVHSAHCLGVFALLCLAVSPAAPRAVLAADSSQQPFYAFKMILSTLDGRGETTLRLKDAHTWNRQQPVDPVAAAKCNALGHSLFKQNDFKASLANFENAKRLDCNNPEYAENTGFLFLLTGQYQQSIIALLTSLEINPGRASVWYTLAKAYSYLNKDDLAYACIINACLFSKKRENTLAFIGKYASENPSLTVVTPFALDACATIGLDGAFRTRYPGAAQARSGSGQGTNAPVQPAPAQAARAADTQPPQPAPPQTPPAPQAPAPVQQQATPPREQAGQPPAKAATRAQPSSLTDLAREAF